MCAVRTRQHYCDNVTMFSGHTIVGYCITVCLYSLWLLLFHIFFLSRKLYYVVALSRCRVSRAQLCHYICLYKYFLVRPYTIYLSLQKQNRCCDKCPVKKVSLPPPGAHVVLPRMPSPHSSYITSCKCT